MSTGISRDKSAGEKQKSLDSVLAQIEKNHGKGAVMRLGDDVRPPVDRPRRGARRRRPAPRPRGRDLRPGVLGQVHARHARRGRGAAQRRHLRLHRRRARDGPRSTPRSIGVDIDQLLISQPDTGEQALEIADMLVRSGALDVVVIDSVAALTPRAEIEGEMGDTHVGLQARLMSQALRKLTGQPQQDQHHLHLHQPAAREDRRHVRFARDHPGGRALKFYSSVRLDIRRIESHQGRHRGRRQPHPRQGGQEQGGAAVQAGRVRHHVRQGHQP
jgi:recombination protein RecA